MSNRRVGSTRAVVGVGVTLLIAGMAWLVYDVVTLEWVDGVGVQATAGLRMPASLAVFGCLVAAFGYWKQEQETLND